MPRRPSSRGSSRGSDVPATPLHLVGAWAFYFATGRRGSLVAISLGSLLVDLEVPVYWALTGFDPYHSRGILHSILGTLTVDVLLTYVTMRFLLPPVWRSLGKRWPKRRLYTFAGVDLRRDAPGPWALYLSAAAGALSHLWLDLPTHSFNPLLWPETSDPLNLVPFSEYPPWEIGFNLVLLALLLLLIRRYWAAWSPPRDLSR